MSRIDDATMIETLEQKESWTVLEVVQWGTGVLSARGFESARLNVELLLAHVLECKRIDLYTGFDRPLTREERERFKELFGRRLAHEPLQYVTGEAEFMGLRFVVDRRVLIPRPETEVLVEQSLALIKEFPANQQVLVLEVGTGSGNIAVSVARFAPNAVITTIDVSGDALEVARENVNRHHVGDRVRLVEADLFGAPAGFPSGGFNLLLSNPPYISKEEMNALQPEIVRHEPRVAVFSEGDELKFFRRIAEIGSRMVKRPGWILVETAFDQGSRVRSIFSEAGYSSFELVKDYGGVDRVLKVKVD